MIRYILFFFSLLGFLQAGSFKKLPQKFPQTGSTLTIAGVTSCYIPSTKQIFYTWVEEQSPNFVGYYAIYDIVKQDFTTPRLPLGINPQEGIFCCYNSNDDQVVFSYVQETKLAYGTYKPNSTKPGSPVFSTPVISSIQALGNVTCCYDGNSTVFGFQNQNQKPALCTLLHNILSEATEFPDAPIVIGTVYCCSAPLRLTTIFTYRNQNNGLLTIYKDYPVSDSFPVKNKTVTTNAYGSLFCTYDSKNDEVFLSWITNGDFLPVFRKYSLSKSDYSSDPITLSSQTIKTSIDSTVFSCTDGNGNMIFSWGHEGPVYYSVYKNSALSAAPPLPGQPIFPNYSSTFPNYSGGVSSYGAYCCYGSNQVFFSWSNLGPGDDGYPWYAIYTVTPITLKNGIIKFGSSRYQKGMLR